LEPIGHRQGVCKTPVDGDALEAFSPVCASLPASCLLELPDSVLDDIASWAVQPGASGALSLTCRAFAQANLRHAPTFRIQLDRQRCDQLLTPRVIAVLRARTGKLALTLEQSLPQGSNQDANILAHILDKLGSCAAVEAVKLSSSGAPHHHNAVALACTPDLAQHLLDSFPGLTALSLHNYTVTCSHLAGLLPHPQLAMQLQQLDLTGTSIRLAQQPDQPGAATLATLFRGLRLKRLSLDVGYEDMPSLQPLAQHLTQLHIGEPEAAPGDAFTTAVGSLPLLQVLSVSDGFDCIDHQSLSQLLQALPLLHTLQLAETTLWCQQELDALLAATQLTSVHLEAICGLTSSRAETPCSWQRLELTDSIDCTSAAYLPLHSLTQPLVLRFLNINTAPGNCSGSCSVAAAVHNLTQACRVPVKIKCLELDMTGSCDMGQAMAVLQPLGGCCSGDGSMLSLSHAHVSAKDIALLAPLCQGCSRIGFRGGSLLPSLEFWHQVVQLMPNVTHITMVCTEGVATADMWESLQLMAAQPWARWLDIIVVLSRQLMSKDSEGGQARPPLSQFDKAKVTFLDEAELPDVVPQQALLGAFAVLPLLAASTLLSSVDAYSQPAASRGDHCLCYLPCRPLPSACPAVPAMTKRNRHIEEPAADDSALTAPSPACSPPPAISLLELPESALDDIASWAVRWGASGALSLTCRAFAQANLRHAPTFRIQLDRQRCDQLLTPRVIAALRARTGKLALTLEQSLPQGSNQDANILAHILDKLGSCAAVEAVKLSRSGAPHHHNAVVLACTPDLAQRLLDSFPGLTAIAVHKYTIFCSHLAGLISHPQLALQLQQLDLTGTSICQAGQPHQPGAVTLANLFQGLRLKRLSLDVGHENISLEPLTMTDNDDELLPDLRPLAQHLTQLQWRELPYLDIYRSALGLKTLSQLKVLTVCNLNCLWGLIEDLRALPQLHTLQLAETTLRCTYELDILLAATQLTSIQLASVQGLTSSRASAPCSWQRLELTGSIDCTSAAHLPLHSLTQPLVLGELCCSVDLVTTPEAAAALHSLAGAWKQPPVVRCVQLEMFGRLEEEAQAEVEAVPEGADITPLVQIILQQQSSRWEQLVALLCKLELRCVDKVVVSNFLRFSAADVQVLAPFCQACTCLQFLCSSIWPSLDFWHELVQCMPSVTHVLFTPLQDAPASGAMHESLQLMAEHSWARWLDITISYKHPEEVAYWQAQDWSSMGKCKVHVTLMA
ncbi:hypothetical protein QJQ45_027033, partial [Haematococcus lacustris]